MNYGDHRSGCAARQYRYRGRYKSLLRQRTQPPAYAVWYLKATNELLEASSYDTQSAPIRLRSLSAARAMSIASSSVSH